MTTISSKNNTLFPPLLPELILKPLKFH